MQLALQVKGNKALEQHLMSQMDLGWLRGPDDQWREVATRLVADTALLDRGFERDFLARLGPSKPMGAYVLEAGRVVLTRLDKLSERLDTLYGDQLDTNTRERLHAARHQLQAINGARSSALSVWGLFGGA